MNSYPERLLEAMKRKSSPVALGLDPREDLIPGDCFPAGKRDPSAVAEAFFCFGKRLLKVLAPHIAAVKLQIAFYERLGVPGLEAYGRTMRLARELGVIAIGDIKRGDIGSTSEAYADAHLGGLDGRPGPFEADAVTLNPWLGGDSLEPFFARCRERGKGVYLLLHTSNPGSADLQELAAEGGGRVYERLAGLIAGWQGKGGESGGYSAIGAVLGATFPEELRSMRDRLPRAPLLVPGYGAQGAKGRDVAFLYGDGMRPHLIAASRSLAFGYRDKGLSLEDGAIAAVQEMKMEILG